MRARLVTYEGFGLGGDRLRDVPCDDPHIAAHGVVLSPHTIDPDAAPSGEEPP